MSSAHPTPGEASRGPVLPPQGRLEKPVKPPVYCCYHHETQIRGFLELSRASWRRAKSRASTSGNKGKDNIYHPTTSSPHFIYPSE